MITENRNRFHVRLTDFSEGRPRKRPDVLSLSRAWATSLRGPWTLEARALIGRGSGDDFDARHVDAVSAYYSRDTDEILYCYMGYPERAQPQPSSPFGSAQGVATENAATGDVRKCGPILRPSEQRGHWASGWVGGLQLLRGADHRWIAVLNASPRAPDRTDRSLWREEPPPSLGGAAVCDEERPLAGWRWCDEPFEWIEEVPEDARATGEGGNLWRHHVVLLDDGRAALFYNSGEYFKERLFLKIPRW